MRVDWFMADVGIAQTPSDAVSADVVSKLADEAEGFLRACGTLSWSEWRMMAPESQVAFVAAGDRIRQETAGLIGGAAASEGVAKALLQGRDPEDVAVEGYLSTAHKALRDQLTAGDGA